MSATAGYSGAPLSRKLGIKLGARLGLIGAPPSFDATPGELPPGVEVLRCARHQLDVIVALLDVIVAFSERRAALACRLPALRAALDPAGRPLDRLAHGQLGGCHRPQRQRPALLSCGGGAARWRWAARWRCGAVRCGGARWSEKRSHSSFF